MLTGPIGPMAIMGIAAMGLPGAPTIDAPAAPLGYCWGIPYVYIMYCCGTLALEDADGKRG